MTIIGFPARSARQVELIHSTTPRVGIFVMAPRARATGPQAHLWPYVADEEQAGRRQVRATLLRAISILWAVALVLYLSRALLDWSAR